ncbi:MAG: sigma 54-interacting transcriptional regulator, partial [Chloroflexota bacterium]
FLIILYHEQKSRVLELADGEEIIIGRGDEVGLTIADSKISNQHTKMWREGHKIFVEDLGSTNGTQVNGITVQAAHRIGPGDEVSIGSATLMVSSLALTVGHHRILTDGEFEERLDAEVDRAKRYRRPLSLIMLRLAGHALSVRKHLAAIASVLRQMDVLASYGPREYAILLPEADAKSGEGVVRRLTLPPDSKDKLAVGLVTLPMDAQSTGMLVEIARERLRSARGESSPVRSREKPAKRIIVAESRSMIQAMTLAHRVASLRTTVLILGETGSGKQIVAEEIHQSSPRAKGPFIHVNCAAIPLPLMESELFGHERGAFTGADSRHSGFVEVASGGSLFLDEIGELPDTAQPKLLHFLESQTFTRVGGVTPIQADVRIIAATNRDLEVERKNGRFREDLYFRLSAFVVHMPPLRERPDDILPLASLFCTEFAAAMGQQVPTFSEGALDALRHYTWPGNIRQLRNAIERAMVLSDDSRIEEAHLPERVLVDPSQATKGPLEQKLTRLEQKTIEDMLHECGGNQSETARRLGISRRSLIYRMKKLGLRRGTALPGFGAIL